MKKIIQNFVLLSLSMTLYAAPSIAYSFESGNFYSISPFGFNNVTQFSAEGESIDSLNYFTTSGLNGFIHGMAFGPDNLLYLVTPVDGDSYSVTSVNAEGQVQMTYHQSGRFFNASHGAITFDDQGHFYVGEDLGATQFVIGNSQPIARIWSDSPTFDVASIDNGNLILLNPGRIYETSTDGAVVREITLSDPNGVSGIDTPIFGGYRSIAHDVLTNTTYVSMFGGGDFGNQVMRIDLNTGFLLDTVTFAGPVDIEIASDGRVVVVGSGGDRAIGIFDANLDFIELFDAPGALFIAEYHPVPLPSALLLVLSSMMTLFYFRK